MKIFCMDTTANGLDFLMRCQDAGHEVMWWIRETKDRHGYDSGKGIVPRLTDWEKVPKWLGWADLIWLPDNAHYIDFLEPYRKMGYPIFGPSVDATELELDRSVGQEAMKKAGLKTIPGVTFDDYDKAAAFVEKHPTYLVSKPSGDADKALSYVAPDAASLIHMLVDRWKKNDKFRRDSKKHGFILQEKKSGVEMAVGGWFGPSGWSPWWYENFEEKKLMNGGLGPNTGEMGTISRYTKKSKLAEVALLPMTKQLRELQYVGFIDNAGMIDTATGQFWPFEFTPRPPWPGWHNHMAALQGDPAQCMCDLLDGQHTMRVSTDVVCSVVMAIPDFPYSHFTNKVTSDIPIYGCHDREHVHLSEVKLGEAPMMMGDQVVRGPCFVTAGDYVCVVTGKGETISSARRSAYAAVKKIQMPADPFYRTDIGVRLKGKLEEIQKHGYATGMSF